MNDGRRAGREGGEGAHYVSVISRIRRVFSICSKAPLVRRRPALVAWARAPAPAEKDAGKNREKPGKLKKKRRKEGRAGWENMIRAKEEKPGASARAIYARITRVNRVVREREREKAVHVFFVEG